MNIRKESKKLIKLAAKNLKDGKLISIMAETVYGLGVDATNSDAIKKLYKLKKRPNKNPLIIHVNSIEMSEKIGILNKDFYKLASVFWPGPLTFIVQQKKDSEISKIVNSKLSTVALRMPSYYVFLATIKALNKPIAAPSANISGYLSSTNAQHVFESFGEKISLIIDSGQCELGIESTIINMTTRPYVIERLGAISKNEIFKKTGIKLKDKNTFSEKKIIAPGQLSKHYAPSTPIRLNAKKPKINEAFLCFGEQNKNYEFSMNLSSKGCLSEAAHNLFDYLRKLDKLNKVKIAVSAIPNKDIGKTINERLKRAIVKS